jgi:hypothetical protein
MPKLPDVAVCDAGEPEVEIICREPVAVPTYKGMRSRAHKMVVFEGSRSIFQEFYSLSAGIPGIDPTTRPL